MLLRRHKPSEIKEKLNEQTKMRVLYLVKTEWRPYLPVNFEISADVCTSRSRLERELET